MQIDKPLKSKPGAARWGSDHITDAMRALGIEYLALTIGISPFDLVLTTRSSVR